MTSKAGSDSQGTQESTINKSPDAPSESQPVPHTPKISVNTKAKAEGKETPSLIKKKAVDPPKEKEVKTPVLAEEVTPYTEEDLQKVWDGFKKERTNKASDTEKLVLNRRLEKTDNHNVKIFLESQLEISILEKFEAYLIQHLRKELKNTEIQIEKEVSEQEESKNLYTSKEKFEYMAKQNPELRKLKDRLGLDFEY